MSELSHIDINNVDYNIKDAQSRSIINSLLAASVVSGSYNSTNHTIELKNSSNVVVSTIPADAFIKDGMVSSVAIVNGNLVISFNTDAGKSPISIPLTSIFNPSNYYQKSEIDSKLTEKQSEISNLESRIGYYECSSEASSASKTIAASNYVLGNGGSVKIKMQYANTADNATLNINSTGAKPLYYDGERASANNTWEAGETVEVYYDGTSYYANNVAGGSGSGDGVFDVSAKYPTSGVEGGNTYTLEGALAVLNANLSPNKKKGGMSIKFVQSSDNKYVQFRYMLEYEDTTAGNAAFVNPDNWQGVDDNPAAGSDNLVKSGGIGEIFASKGITELSFNIVGGIKGNDGTDSSSSGFRRTGYILVTQGMKLTYDLKAGSTGWGTIACYDSNGDYMSNVSVKGQSSGVFTVPSGVAKIRCASEATYTNTYAKFPFIADNTLDYPNVTTSKIKDKSVTYPKLGNDVNSYLNRLLDISFTGGVNYNDGSIGTTAGTNHKMTWYVKVLEGEKINYNLLGGSANWAVIAAYNASFEYIKASSIAGNSDATTPSTGQYVVPSGVAYIILSGANIYDNSASFDVFETNRVNQIVNEKISEFDGSLLFKNRGGINADGSDSNNSNFVKTDLIEVSEGDIIAASVSDGTAWCAFACYDSQHDFISENSIMGTNAAQSIRMTIPQGVSYIKIASVKDYTDRYATKNKVIRENDLVKEEDAAKVNIVSIMKYGNILQQRGCIAIQMDLSYIDDERTGYESMLNVLREYGLMSMDYSINVTAMQDANIGDLLKKQDEGCEIIYHNRINSPSDFSDNSTLTVEELKAGVCAEKKLMAQKGFTTFGVVANVGRLAARYKPTVDNIFFWSEYGSKAPDEAYENTKTQYLTDHRIIRTGFDIIDSQYTTENEQQIINYAKAWIDNLCTNKTFGVMYCHRFEGSFDNYRLYETTLRPIAAYIAEKISNGELWYGRTTECLNYLCR